MSRTVLIGGGAGALGSAVTAEFLAAGWRAVVPVRSEGSVDERAITVKADLFDAGAVATVVDTAASDAEAPLKAVVNLVGGYASGGRVHETGIEDFEQQLTLNLRPAYLLVHAALPHLVANGGGAIVCTSSRAAVRPFSGAAGYITAKAGVLAFTDALAVEYKADNVRANVILPGVIDTPANRADRPGADRSGWTAPADIAKVVRYLCEDESAAITGSHVHV